MASPSSQSFRNLPATGTEMSALKRLLDGDLEHRSYILRRQEEVQAQGSYSEKAAEIFTNCLTATNAVKDAYAASILSTKALTEALNNALHFYDDHSDVLATISSTKGMLATWAEIVAVAEPSLALLDKALPQVGTHLLLAADEQAAHESARIAASESLLLCTDSLRAVDRSIAQKRGALYGVRFVPTEILLRIFTEAVDARQQSLINSLSSYYGVESPYYRLYVFLTTFNFVPFTLSATCKRWRAICRSTPRLWRYLRVPTISARYPRNMVMGKTQLEQCVLLAQNQPLELTIYPIYGSTTYSDLVLPAESQIHRVNIAGHHNHAIPQGIPSPIELCIVASANSRSPYPQALPEELLVNTKKLQCVELTPWIGHLVGVQCLHISLSKRGTLPSLHDLQNYPQLEELYLEVNHVYDHSLNPSSFVHQRLHTLSLTDQALPWLVHAFHAGCGLPRLARLVFTDININDGFSPTWWRSQTDGRFSHITHIEVHGVSATDVTQFRPLFDVATGLRTLTLVNSGVEPILTLLTSSIPKRVDELILRDSEANGTTLRDYLVAVERDNGGYMAGVKVEWENCPNFIGEYGMAYGELCL